MTYLHQKCCFYNLKLHSKARVHPAVHNTPILAKFFGHRSLTNLQLQRPDETLMLLLLMMMMMMMMQKRMMLMLMMTPALTLAMIGLTTTWRRHCAINYEYLHACHVVR